jgi:hypothetical protein
MVTVKVVSLRSCQRSHEHHQTHPTHNHSITCTQHGILLGALSALMPAMVLDHQQGARRSKQIWTPLPLHRQAMRCQVFHITRCLHLW